MFLFVGRFEWAVCWIPTDFNKFAVWTVLPRYFASSLQATIMEKESWWQNSNSTTN